VLQTKQSGCTCVSPTPPVIQYFVAFQLTNCTTWLRL